MSIEFTPNSLLFQWRRLPPECDECHGAGEIFTHADDCDDDLCALNGDIHSCIGQVVPCACTHPDHALEGG